jgi:VWFA-related protein
VKPGEGLFQKKMTVGQEFSNELSSLATRRLTIIALDSGSSGVTDQRRARDAMLKYLAGTQIESPTALITFTRNGIHVIHDFSADPKVLEAAIGKLKVQMGWNDDKAPPDHRKLLQGTTSEDALTDTAAKYAVADLTKFALDPDGMYKQFDRENGIRSTLENFEQLARVFRGLPGRKEVIWVTAAFPYAINDPDESESMNYSVAYKRTFDLLNDANIAVYPVDIRGLLIQLFPDISVCSTCGGMMRGMPGAEIAAASRVEGLTERTADIATLESFAKMTGGKAFYNRNDIDRSMEAATKDAAGYYMLGYYDNSPASAKSGWKKIKVKAKPDGLKLRARSGYFNLPDNAIDKEIEMRRAALSNIQYTGLPITARILSIDQVGAKKRVKVGITVDSSAITIDETANNRVAIDFMGIARTAKGEPSWTFTQTFQGNLKTEDVARFRATPMQYGNFFELNPGEYSLRVIVRDSLSGRIGTVIAPVKVD